MIRCVLRITISASVGGCIHCLVGPFDVRLHFVVRLDDDDECLTQVGVVPRGSLLYDGDR